MFYQRQDSKPDAHPTPSMRVVHKRIHKTVRRLTVSYSHHATQAALVESPYIRLKGKWLEGLGFVRGKK